MAAKLIVLLIAGAALAGAQEPCTCEDEKTLKEATDIFQFLNRLSSDVETADDEKLPTLPALLSPLVPCGNCVENNRKKRKVFPDVVPQTTHSRKEVVKHHGHGEHTSTQHEEHRSPGHGCPRGYRRIAFMCLNLTLL